MGKVPFAWFGGKASFTHLFLPLIPPHTTYCEPFAGSLALLFAKPPSRVEIVNDMDSGLVNFYRVLRDAAMAAELMRRLALTPYSREEMRFCSTTWQAVEDPVERAARWFTFVRQSVAGMVLLCGHEHPIYAPLLAAGWTQHVWDVRVRAMVLRKGSTQARRRESIWLNAAARAAHPQLRLEGMA